MDQNNSEYGQFSHSVSSIADSKYLFLISVLDLCAISLISNNYRFETSFKLVTVVTYKVIIAVFGCNSTLLWLLF